MIMSAGILLLWLSDILPALFSGQTPDILKDRGYTLFIQALDLGVAVPVSIITGVLLFQKSPWGLILAPVVLVKGFTLVSAVVSMIYFMQRAGTPASTGEIIFFLLADIGLAFLVFFNIKGVKNLSGCRSPSY